MARTVLRIVFRFRSFSYQTNWQTSQTTRFKVASKFPNSSYLTPNMEKFNSAKMYSSNATAWKPLFNYLQLSGCLSFGRWEKAATATIGNSLRSNIRKTCWYSLAASPSRNTNSKLTRTSCRRPIMFRADESSLPSFLLSFRDFYCFMLQSITRTYKTDNPIRIRMWRSLPFFQKRELYFTHSCVK